MVKKNRVCVAILVGCMLVAFLGCTAEQGGARKPVALETEADKESYVLGTQAGQRFQRQGDAINLDAYIRGVEDVLLERELALSDDEIQQVTANRRERIGAERRKQREEQARLNLAESNAFLEENKTKPGVVVLPSGLQYKVLKEGTGRTPTENDLVKVHYRATLYDGREIDSSYKREEPREFTVARLAVAGWKEALQLMKEGDKWELFIPPELAYGERGRPPRIPGNTALVFEMELIKVMEQPAESETTEAQQGSG